MAERAIIWCAVSTAAQANEEEKYSLPAQEADAKALCAREGWQIVDILRVPGHSRDYKSIDKLAADAAEKGIDAFYRLIEHLETCDFDVLVCRDANRFARRASLMAYIIESIVEDCGRRIYSFNDGWVDKQNAGMFAAMKGYSAAQDIKFLVDARRRGMHSRAERGLLLSPRDPLSHVTIRDTAGKAIRTEVNEARRRLWDDLATLILEGVAWQHMEQVLYERFGHVDHSGRIFQTYTMYYLVSSPTFWGHIAIGRYYRGALRSRRTDTWIFDAAEAPPDGIAVYRNRIPPVFTGELAARIQAEVRRRLVVVQGNATPGSTHRYSSVFVCGHCGGGMVYFIGKRYRALRCSNTQHRQRGVFLCDARSLVAERAVDAEVDKELRRKLAGLPLEAFEPPTANDAPMMLIKLETEIAATTQQLERMVYEQSLQPESVQARYRTMIARLSEQLDTLERAAFTARRQAEQAAATAEQEARAVEDLRHLTLEGFWELPDRAKNQMLHRLLVNRQYVLLDRRIVGSVQRRRARSRRNKAGA